MASKSQTKASTKTGKNVSQSGKSDTKQKKKVTLAEEDDMEGKEESLAFKILTQEQSTELLGHDVVDMQKCLCEIFKLQNCTTDLKDGAVLDYYTSAVWFAKEHGFDAQQLSGFFTVVHKLLDNVKEQHIAMIDNLKEFKKMFVGLDPGNMSSRTSGGLDFFNTEQAKTIIKYVHSSFFQHYKLFELMFSQTQAEEIIGTDLEIEVAKPANMPFPPPLDEGVSQEMFTSYIATPPPTPTPEDDEEAKLKELEEKIEKDIFAELTPEDIREVIESVTSDMLGSLQIDMAAKLREKENNLISRINKVHRIADDSPTS